jgi:glutamate synthase (NADPH/NADH) large chain
MSGGVAYVWDQTGDFNLRCNLELVELEQVVDGDDIAELKELIARHHKFTDSAVAQQILEEWDQMLGQFIKVMPTDYKRVLAEHKANATADASS